MKRYLFIVAAPLVQAGTFYTDTTQTAYLSPGLVNVGLGDNRVSGTLAPSGFCPDFYTLRIPEGLEVVSLLVEDYQTGDGNSGSFLGIQQGATLSDSPAAFVSGQASTTLPFFLIGTPSLGRTDLLPTISDDVVGPGVTVLPAGDYALWFNETDPNTAAQYVVNFQAQAVPEPSVSIGVLFGAIILARRRRS